MDRLFIENYSNTEFVREPDVYDYLIGLSELLKHNNTWMSGVKQNEKDCTGDFTFMRMWYRHVGQLMNEIFNNFLCGNFLSVAAMTRTLIECYVYIHIMKKENESGSEEEWLLCGVLRAAKIMGRNDRMDLADYLIESLEEYCAENHLDFEDKYNRYYVRGGNENSWLSNIIQKKNNKRITFRDACDYVSDCLTENTYDDYQNLSAFVHGQDIRAQFSYFTWYSSIYSVLYKMSTYIFSLIRLLNIEDELEEEISRLDEKLQELGKRYL